MAAEPVGVGPHPTPWPDDPRLDPVLLAEGDRRNVVDGYRYWSVEAITAALDPQRMPFHVAVENWQHDLNIGTLVRNANAFLAAAVHIIGDRRWNRRGAMVTDRYQHVLHHPTLKDFEGWAGERGAPDRGHRSAAWFPPASAGVYPQALRAALWPGRSGTVHGCPSNLRAGVAHPAIRLDPFD